MSLTCKICYECPNKPCVTSCGHVFCTEHIQEWFQQGEHSCPVCRRLLDINTEVTTVYADEKRDTERGSGSESARGGSGDLGDDLLDFKTSLERLNSKWEKAMMERIKLMKKVTAMEEEHGKLKALLEHHERETTMLTATVRKDRGLCPAAVERRLTGKWELGQTYSLHKGPVHGIAMHSARNVVATASWDHTCKVFDVDTSRLIASLNHNHKGLYAVAFSKTNASVLGTVSSDALCRIWNYETGECMRALERHSDEVNSLAFHSFKDVVATASDDQCTILWDIERGAPALELRGHTNTVYGVKFQPYGNLIATGSFDWTSILWDDRTGRMVHQFTGHTDDIIGVDWDDAGYTLATGSDDKTCRVWDLRMQSCLAVLNKHTGDVKRIAFSPFGRVLATTSGDMTTRLWCMKTFQCIDTLKGHADHVFDAAWSADADFLVTASHDQKFKLWRPAQPED